MKRDKLIPGIILICLGAIFLLHSFGYVHIHLFNLIRLWPIFLVMAGVNLLLANNRTAWASALRVLVIIGGFCLVLFSNFSNRWTPWPTFIHYHYDDNDDDDDNGRHIVKVEGSSAYDEAFHPGIKVAKLNISGGGTRYELRDSTNELFQAFTKEVGGKYTYNSHIDDSVAVLNFNMEKNQRFDLDDSHTNKATIKLNTQPLWDMSIQTGATDLDFDLSRFKLRNLDLSGGAASFKIKVGEPLESTRLDISTGVSEVKISIPRNAACQISTDSGLSSNHFDGFNKTGDGHYETTGFANAKNKIYINIDGGISDFRVSRY